MIRNDYILRLIDLLGVFIAKLMLQVERGELVGAKEEVDAISRKIVGLPLAVLESNPAEGLVSLLSAAVGPDYPRIMAAGIILDARAQVACQEADEVTAFRLWTSSASLLITGACSLNEEISDRCHQHLEEVMRRLTEYEIPACLHLALAEHYEACGRFSRAEDHVYEGLQDDPERVAKWRAFFKRLEQLSDAELEAGNLSRGEVRQSLSDLVSGDP